MSEYQYYEFRALDRPLTSGEMRELRALSTRAEITSTSLTNHYDYGDFKGDPRDLVQRMFDAFVYVSNWGSYELLFRLPLPLFDAGAAAPYLVEEVVTLTTTPEAAVLSFRREDDGGRGEFDDGEHWMGSLALLRADLMAGDRRALYLGWLRGVPLEIVDEDAPEPPVPPGLGDLSASLQAFTEFLDLDPNLVAAAAETSGPLATPSRDDLTAWVAALPASEKDRLVVDLLDGQGAHQIAAWRVQFARSCRPANEPEDPARRTAGDLLARATQMVAMRKRQEAERRERERQEAQRKEAEEREKRIQARAGKQEQAWRDADELVRQGHSAAYAQAAEVLADLQELAQRQGTAKEFQARLSAFHEQYRRRSSLVAHLRATGLL